MMSVISFSIVKEIWICIQNLNLFDKVEHEFWNNTDVDQLKKPSSQINAIWYYNDYIQDWITIFWCPLT
jgi:hypothetical protein